MFADDTTIPLPAMYVDSVDPAVTYTDGRVKADRLWLDTSTGSIGTLKKRNADNDGWDTLIDFDAVIAAKLRESTGPTILSLGAIADGNFLKRNGSTVIGASPGGGGLGDVVGPAGATDNAIARYDSTTGKLIQNSVVIVSDAGVITVPEVSAPSTPASGTVHIYAKSDGHLYIKDDTGTETDLTGSGGGSTNPTTLFVPYNNAGTFDDSRIKRENTNITAINGGLNTAQTLKIYGSDDGSGNAHWIQVTYTGSNQEILSTASGSAGISNIVFRVAGGGNGVVLGTSGFQPVTDRGFSSGSDSNRWDTITSFNFRANGGAFVYANNWTLGAYGDGKAQFAAAGGDVTQRLTFGDINGGVALCRTSGQNGYFEIKSGDGTTFKGLRSQYYRSEPVTVANLPSSPVEGMLVAVTDSNTATWGATIAGGGSNHVLAYYNGTNWTVAAA